MLLNIKSDSLLVIIRQSHTGSWTVTQRMLQKNINSKSKRVNYSLSVEAPEYGTENSQRKTTNQRKRKREREENHPGFSPDFGLTSAATSPRHEDK